MFPSECRVDDPTIDLTAHLRVFGEEGLQKLLDAYAAAGGRVWPKMAHHVEGCFAYSPVAYALFGLESGDAGYLAAVWEPLGVE